MEKHQIPIQERGAFRKWIRSYLDFCQKYRLQAWNEESLRAFIAKLKTKGQSTGQQEQAKRAVRLLVAREGRKSAPPGKLSRETGRDQSARVREEPLKNGRSWEREYQSFHAAAKVRNYSGKTLEAYQHWLRKFQGFVRSKSPADLDSEDVKAFLTHLAVEQGVTASTQNQAFNALLFFFRQVLRRESGEVRRGESQTTKRPPHSFGS